MSFAFHLTVSVCLIVIRFAEKMAKDIRNKQKPPGKLGDFLKWSSKKSAKRRAFAKVLDIQGEKNRITGLKEGLNKFIGRFQVFSLSFFIELHWEKNVSLRTASR